MSDDNIFLGDISAPYDTEINDLQSGTDLKEGENDYDAPDSSDEKKTTLTNKETKLSDFQDKTDLFTKIVSGTVTGTTAVAVVAVVVATNNTASLPTVTAPILDVASTTLNYDVPITNTSKGDMTILLTSPRDAATHEDKFALTESTEKVSFHKTGSFTNLLMGITYTFKVQANIGLGTSTLYSKALMTGSTPTITDVTPAIDFRNHALSYALGFQGGASAAGVRFLAKLSTLDGTTSVQATYSGDSANNSLDISGFDSGQNLILAFYDSGADPAKATPLFSKTVYLPYVLKNIEVNVNYDADPDLFQYLPTFQVQDVTKVTGIKAILTSGFDKKTIQQDFSLMMDGPQSIDISSFTKGYYLTFDLYDKAYSETDPIYEMVSYY
jgi:hypothetical protein